MNKIKKFVKSLDGKLLIIFIVIIILANLLNFGVNSFMGMDYCTGGISHFEARHCGLDGRIPGSYYQMSIHDIFLRPAVLLTPLFYPYIFDDVYLHFEKGLSLYFNVFYYEDSLSVIGAVAPIVIWLLNIAYMLALICVMAWIWKKKWWGKLIVLAIFVILFRMFIYFGGLFT